MPVGDLFDLCAEYLAACEAAVAVTPGGPITRAYVSPGPPAFDCCPQLTVHAGGVTEAATQPLSPALLPGLREALTGAVPLIQLTATVLRCVPVVGQAGSTGLPSASSIQAAAVETCADVWAIWHELRKGYKDGTLFVGNACKRELFFDPAPPINTSGGCAGWQIPIRVSLEGYA